MTINTEDPKWTAYVLGELNDRERAQVERELESSAAAREFVEEIRSATNVLRQELANEPAAELSSSQHRTIAVAAAPPRLKPIFRWALVGGSIAAGILVVLALATPSMLRSRQAAMSYDLPPAAPGGPKFDESKGLQPAQGARNELDRFTAEYRLQKGQALPMPPGTPPVLSGVLGGVLRAKTAPGTLAESPATAALADRDRERFNTEAYDFISDNPFIRVAQDPLATFSIDVDTASYANIRRFLTMNTMPPKDSVRIEEMINYFTYEYPSPSGRNPIAAYTEVAAAPWKPDHRLVRIGIKAKDIDVSRRPPSNLVFLIDVSGSMATPEKLPMLKNAMRLLVDRLGEGDHVAIVTYAGISGLQLPSTNGDKKEIIEAAIERLGAGGSTNGAAGIVLAYETALSSFIPGGINRVILATDGDFNVGVTNEGDLTRLIEDKAKSGVFLSVLGFGMGNYKDSTLEKLADKGNGNYAYIDSLNEARKVLVEEMSGTLLTVAKDVKIQVEFNPAEVNAYRLIGYENRALRHEDFNDDRKDAGDMGAGHTVTALFEVVPRGVEIDGPEVDPLRYQQPAPAIRRSQNGELLNLKIRYKEPDGNTSQLLEAPVVDRSLSLSNASADFRFAAAVASFGMILRDSPHKGQSNMDAVIEMAEKSRGSDKNGYRQEFLQLVRRAKDLKKEQ